MTLTILSTFAEPADVDVQELLKELKSVVDCSDPTFTRAAIPDNRYEPNIIFVAPPTQGSEGPEAEARTIVRDGWKVPVVDVGGAAAHDSVPVAQIIELVRVSFPWAAAAFVARAAVVKAVEQLVVEWVKRRHETKTKEPLKTVVELYGPDDKPIKVIEIRTPVLSRSPPNLAGRRP
jgi:hypothetical protein